MRLRGTVIAILAIGTVTLTAASQAQGPVGRASGTSGGQSQPLTIDADKMERYGKEGVVIFSGNVVARHESAVHYADRMEVYLDEKGDRILRTVSTGAVRIITKDCRTATARRAEYSDLEQRVILLGDARVWQEDNVVTGDTITVFLSQDRSVVESGKNSRVQAIFYPRGGKDAARSPKRPSAECRN